MKKQTNFLKIIYFIKFFSDALFSGYLSMYFASMFDRYSLEYGLLLGVIPFCALIGNFIWGLLSKNVTRNLLLIKIILSLESLAMLMFISFGHNFNTIFLATILFGLFNSPCFTMQDGLGSLYSKKEDVSYPSIRYKGSIGYLCALATGAGLIQLFKNEFIYIFIISLVLNVLCLILWFFIKPFENVTLEEKKKVKFLEVLKNKTFILYFIAYLLIIGSNNVADSYLFSRMSEVGIQSYQYSLFFAGEVLVEIIVIMLVARFAKDKHYLWILKISILIIFVRSFLFGFNLPLPVLIAFAPLRGIGWGGFLSIHILILRKIVSDKLVTKAISLLTVALSFVNGLMTIFGTKIYSQLTLPGFYFLLSGIEFIGIIIIYLMKFKYYEEVNYENKNIGRS